ncbi:MAG TPA: hypothetical protein VJ253_09010 [Dehalococcoidia bacterium]|nr:hypothetical protein [Dehalococcoidia bacterium]
MRYTMVFLAIVITALTIAGIAIADRANAMSFGSWSQPQNLQAAGADDAVNTTALEGCPSISKDGTSLYFASNRAGGLGGVDIYVSARSDVDDPWGAPVNVGPPINTSADELCPAPLRDGHGFMFVSSRPGGCGALDIYATRQRGGQGWSSPVNLGCAVNSAADEASPFVVGGELFFSSTRTGDSDIYVAAIDDGTVGAPVPVPGLNTPSNDARPNLRRDGREIFFDRPGECGGIDLWMSTRPSTEAPWSQPVNLGCGVNSAANDLRASLSWDGKSLYFGSNRAGSEGNQDIYVATRERVPAGE